MNENPTADNTSSSERFDRFVQFIKYCIVGVLNTLVCFGVIYLCKSFLLFST